MANLEWRNVQAPDFTGAMEGLKLFSSLLDKGLGGAQSTFNRWDQTKTDQVNKALMLSLAGINDPETAKTQVEALRLGADPNRVTTETLAALERRPGQLREEKLDELKFAKTTDEYTQESNWKRAMNGSGQELLAYRDAIQSNDPKRIAEARNSLSAKLTSGGASAQQIFNFDPTLMDREKAGFDMATGRVNFDRGTQRWDREVKGWAFDDKVDTIAGQLRAGNLEGTAAEADLRGRLNRGEINGREFGAIAAKLGIANFINFDDAGAGGGDGAGAVGGSFSSAASAGGSPFNVVFGNGKYGQPPKPITEMTMGEVYDYGRNVLIPNTRAKGIGVDPSTGKVVGTSASGAYQIVGTTMEGYARNLFGKNWRNVQYTPEVQDQIAAAIWKDHGGSVAGIRKQWASIDEAEARQLVGKSWAEARDMITQGESGGPVSAMIVNAAAQAGTNVGVQSGDTAANYGDNIPSKFFELAGDRRSPRQVAQDMAKADPTLNPDWVELQINRLLDGAKGYKYGNGRVITAAMAGQAILDNTSSRQASDSWWVRESPASLDSQAIGRNARVNFDGANSALFNYLTGGVDDTVMGNTARGVTAQSVTAAQGQVDSIKARIARKQQAAQARGVRIDLSADLAQLQIAEAALKDAMRMQNAPGNQITPSRNDRSYGANSNPQTRTTLPQVTPGPGYNTRFNLPQSGGSNWGRTAFPFIRQ